MNTMRRRRSGGGSVTRRASATLVALVALAACGGDDAGDGSAGSASAASPDESSSGDDRAGASDGVLGVPDWWPPEVALPTGLVVDAAAHDQGGTASLDLGGSVPGAVVDDVAVEQQAALEAAGFAGIVMDDGSGTLSAEHPTIGRMLFRFTPRDDAVSMTAVLDRPSAERAAAPADGGASAAAVTGDGSGTAIALIGGAQYVSEGTCSDWSFTGDFGEGDAVISIAASFDVATGTEIEYLGRASVTLPDGTTWWADDTVELEPADTGYALYGSATEITADDADAAPFQITVECRG